MKLFINCSFKNTIVTLTDSKNNLLFQTSSQSSSLKVKRKNNPYVLRQLVKQISKKFIKKTKLIIIIKGFGPGRYHLLKYLPKRIKILLIEDRTFLPFNGCKPPKKKRK